MYNVRIKSVMYKCSIFILSMSLYHRALVAQWVR